MATALIPVCSDGELVSTASGVDCTGSWTWVDAAALAAPFDPALLDTELAFHYFGQGWLIVAMCWAIGHGLAIILKSIKRF